MEMFRTGDKTVNVVKFEVYVTKKMSINLDIFFCEKKIEINF